jgi:phosphocarrier protein HPr
MAEATIKMRHEAGLHARPLAAFTKLAKSFPVDIQVKNLTTGKGPANGKSAVHLLLLTVHKGHDILIRATGEGEEAALAALVQLVESNFEGVEGA